MPRAFLSHKTEDKRLVKAVRAYLERSLISTWLDESDLAGARTLWSGISEAIASNEYFIAFLSTRYLASAFCLRELKEAWEESQRKRVTLILVLLEERSKLELERLEPSDRAFVERLLERHLYFSFDSYDRARSCKELLEKGIWPHQLIRFSPVESEEYGGVELRVIRFSLRDNLVPVSALGRLDVDLEHRFLATTDEHALERPLKRGVAVGLEGKGPNWLYAWLAIPFKNLCPVYVFNTTTEAFVCVYDPQKKRLGATLQRPPR